MQELHKYILGTPPIHFVNNPGVEAYNLYMKYSWEHSRIADLGTLQGLSALALSVNPGCEVMSYDIDLSKNLVTKDNINFVKGNCFDYIDDIVECDLILVDIDPHDGIQEIDFYNLLKDKGYKGITLWDDIHLNKYMQRFWDSVGLPKEDLTDKGHHSGTGLIYF